jgi:predicted ATPase
VPTPNDTLVVGRDRELARLGGLLESDRLHCGVVVTGAVGIGRTTVWEAGLAMARERGLRVLAARPAAGEVKRSFAALIDLCDGLGPSALAGLPREQRAALDVALLRAETRGESLGPRAACLGFVNVLRALAAESPLLIAIDDAQWLDAPSSHALALAARRLRGEPVGYLLTRRAAIATPLEQRGAQRIDLGPLSTAAIRGLLTARRGLTLRRNLLHRVVELTQGNPSLAL